MRQGMHNYIADHYDFMKPIVPHQLEGLSDGAPLERYAKVDFSTFTLLDFKWRDRNVLQRIISFGIRFDSGGVYGPEPWTNRDTSHISQGELNFWACAQNGQFLSGEEYTGPQGQMNKSGYFTYNSVHVLNMSEWVKYGISSMEEYNAVALGLERIPILRSRGIYFNNALKVGRIPESRILTLLRGKGYYNVEIDNVDKNRHLINFFMKKLQENRHLLVYVRMHCREYYSNGMSFLYKKDGVFFHVHLKYWAMKYFLEKFGKISYRQVYHFDGELVPETSVEQSIYTSEGQIFLHRGEIFVLKDLLKKASGLHTTVYYLHTTEKLELKKLKSHNVYSARIGERYFIFPSLNTLRHWEGTSLRDAIDSLKRSIEYNPDTLEAASGILSFSYVRRLGYCLEGTKRFLQGRAYFLYTLLKRYADWDEVPEDVMTTKWEVVPTLFEGSSYNPIV